MFITIAAESAEVTKNMTIIKTAIVLSTPEKLNFSKNIKSAEAESEFTVVASSLKPLCTSAIAELPKKLIQAKVKPVGTRSTPMTNSLIVLPFEILAIKSPTNGDQDSHQAQYSSVQPPSQLSFCLS